MGAAHAEQGKGARQEGRRVMEPEDEVVVGLFSFILACLLIAYGVTASGKGCGSAASAGIHYTEEP